MQRANIRLRGVALAVLLLLCPWMTGTATACSCDGENPPCAAVWEADAVFVGLVIDRPFERVGGNLHWTVNRIAVGQTLKGSLDPFVTLVPGERPSGNRIAASSAYPGDQAIGSSCDYGFEVGRQYVIYARRTKDGGWTTSLCTGTKPLENASADLDYFATLPFADTTGRVYGQVTRTIQDSALSERVQNVPAPGVTVAMTDSRNRFTTTTDAEGMLDVQVPAGDYVIAPVVPQTVRVYGSSRQRRVPPKGCAPVRFSLITNGRIEGRVVRSDGSGVSDVTVDVIRAERPFDQRLDSALDPSGGTDKDGRFAIDSILPGRYVLSVNARFGPRLHSPYATTFFPGADRHEATEIVLDEGERKTGFTMVVHPLAETTISGAVVGEDERPIEGAVVQVAVAGHDGMITDTATTDGNGAFQLRVLTGVTYVIHAGLRFEKSVRQAAPVTVQVDGQTDGVRLRIRP